MVPPATAHKFPSSRCPEPPLRTSPKVAKMKSHGLLVLEIWGAGSRGGQDGLQSREMGELVVIILST